MKVLWRAVSVVLVASVSVACAGLHARTQPQAPALDVPPPPPPVVAPLESDAEPPAAQPSPAPADARPAPRMPRVTPAKGAATRKVDKPTEPPPAATPKPSAEAAPPTPSLQTTAKVGELEQKIRALLARATRDLDKIDVRTLGADRRRYDEARRFAEQAGEALKIKNLAFAEQLADKAATLADLLAKR